MASTESHTDSCKRNRSHYYEKKAAFIVKWSDYCRTCGGLGGKYEMYDPSPPGVGLGSGFMTEFEECPDCIDENFCPRCMLQGTDTGEGFGHYTCSKCDWDSEEAETDTQGVYHLPEEPECYCYERDQIDIVEDELAIRTAMEQDLANDPERRARQDEVDNALMFLIGDNDREEEGD